MERLVYRSTTQRGLRAELRQRQLSAEAPASFVASSGGGLRILDMLLPPRHRVRH